MRTATTQLRATKSLQVPSQHRPRYLFFDLSLSAFSRPASVPFTSFVMDETAIGSLAGKDRSPASSSSASVRFSTSSEAIGLAVRSFHAMDETAIGSLAGKDRSLA